MRTEDISGEPHLIFEKGDEKELAMFWWRKVSMDLCRLLSLSDY